VQKSSNNEGLSNYLSNLLLVLLVFLYSDFQLKHRLQKSINVSKLSNINQKVDLLQWASFRGLTMLEYL